MCFVEFWLSLAVLVLGAVAAPVYAATRGWKLWRTFKRTSRRAGAALERVTAKAEQAERHATSLTAGSERLAGAVAHLQGSLAGLAVLRAAYAESRGAFTSLRGAVPRK
jgi:hypothetical protein